MFDGKKCTRCSIYKPLAQFFRKSKTRTGTFPWCNTCSDAAVKARKKPVLDKEVVSRRNRATYAKHKDKILATKKKYRQANRDKMREYSKAYSKSHKKEVAAYDKAAQARRKGLLVPEPCEHCGSTENIQGHHDDYDKPLDVRWFCKSCHKRFHAGTLTHI